MHCHCMAGEGWHFPLATQNLETLTLCHIIHIATHIFIYFAHVWLKYVEYRWRYRLKFESKLSIVHTKMQPKRRKMNALKLFLSPFPFETLPHSFFYHEKCNFSLSLVPLEQRNRLESFDFGFLCFFFVLHCGFKKEESFQFDTKLLRHYSEWLSLIWTASRERRTFHIGRWVQKETVK